MSEMKTNDPNFRPGKRLISPVTWIAGIIATVLVVLLIASYVSNRAKHPSHQQQETRQESVVPDEALVPETQDAH